MLTYSKKIMSMLPKNPIKYLFKCTPGVEVTEMSIDGMS